MSVDNKKEQTELKATNIISVFHPKTKKKIFFVKKAGRHFGFLKKAGRHQNGTGRRALQKRPRQNTVWAVNQQDRRHRKDTKARVAFLMLSKIWKSKLIKLKTKMRIFNSSVKSVLLYSSETWRITKHTVNKIQTFVNRCLRRIMNVKWSDKVSNNTLWTKTCQ